ncbi:MAG: GNAT family N-acetyltransferase [Proteobacteria bacterium]|nr:GNAT family N-acetyltransferase [Pseudomonadota bacterium]
MQDWWFEALAPGRWESVEVLVDGVQARWSYVVFSTWGLKRFSSPAFTPPIGPWIDAPYGTMRRARGLAALIRRLPHHDLLFMQLPPESLDWVQASKMGMSVDARVTYRLEGPQKPAVLEANLDQNTRNALRKAGKMVAVDRGGSIAQFLPLFEETLGRAGKWHNGFARQLERVDEALQARSLRTIYIVSDDAGRAHAGAYIVHDQPRATDYYLFGGTSQEFRNSGAGTLALFTAISDSLGSACVFDFEGSIIRPVEKFFRGFGGNQAATMTIRGYSRPGVIAGAGLSAARAMGLKIRPSPFDI